MKNKYLLTLLILTMTMLLLVSFASCGGTDTPAPQESLAPSETAPVTDVSEVPTEAPAETPTEAPTEEPTEAPTEAPTDAPEESTENEDELDPNDPEWNLIEVGLSGDGKTPCYDGRYLMDFAYFSNSNNFRSYSIQAAFDDLEGYGGSVAMNNYENIGYCFSVNVPDDGNLYVMYYNWANCDFRFNHGVTFDDKASKDCGDWVTNGYAYYSDLKALDDMTGLDGAIIYIWDITYGLAPGAYKMIEEPSLEMNYTYERLGDLEEYWPGLPTNHSAE